MIDSPSRRPFFKRALELGINFPDTANVYSFGASEEVTGRALRDFARREEVVIATKVWGVMLRRSRSAGCCRSTRWRRRSWARRRWSTSRAVAGHA